MSSRKKNQRYIYALNLEKPDCQCDCEYEYGTSIYLII